MSKKGYAGIDLFRWVAALLVVAIHTSPLSSFSETGDFILTRILARTAVPFFLMTSGFFLISRYSCDDRKLIAFVKKMGLIYGAAIVIYLPVNWYNDYFSMDDLLPNIIKDLFFDGTLYHLWYLPAAILGAVIAWYGVKRLGLTRALLLTAFLYVVGLLGDSYYGLAGRIPLLYRFYNLVFQVSDYTRNGIFYTPVFFVLGGIIADRQDRLLYGTADRMTAGTCFAGFVVSLALMTGEALLLHHWELQRHDSMYLFLLPCMYFLFTGLLFFRGKRVSWFSTAGLILYLIHPMMIIGVRGAARLLNRQQLLVENSLFHYLAVCLTSVIFAVAAALLWNRYRQAKGSTDSMAKGDTGRPGTDRSERIRGGDTSGETGRAWIEVDPDNLVHNVRVLQKIMPLSCELMAVVKAAAYGHGDFEISVRLEKMGVKAFAVATIEEGIRLRRYGITGEILILGYTDPARAKELKKYDLMQTLIDFEYADRLNRRGIPVKTHIKIDTGMHRLGLPWDGIGNIREIFGMEQLTVCGLYTHLCCADSRQPEDEAFTRGQIEKFYHLIDELKESGISVPKVHLQSSYGLLNYPELSADYVRAGIALYGVLSAPGDDTVCRPDLRPVLSLKARVVLVRTIPCGDSVGYGRSFVAERDSRIAILSIGYADGFPRNLSGGKAYAVIRQHRVPIVGRICMDQLAVDITDAEDVTAGDIATLIGEEADDSCGAAVVAGQAGSISNELLCRMGSRLPVVVKPHR